MFTPVSLGRAVDSGAPAARPPKTLQEAATGFEALMISQLLKEAHGDSGGWLGDAEDAASQTATGLAEEQFAQALARSGVLGLGKQIVSSLSVETK